MVTTASNQDLIVSVEEGLTSTSGKKVALLSISNQRPETALGKTQGDHVTAYRSFIEMLITAVEGVQLRKAGVIISNTFKALLPEVSGRFDEILNSMEPQITKILSSSKRKEIIQDLRATRKYDEDFLSHHNEIMKFHKRSALMSIVREVGQEFIKQINLDDETAFEKEGPSDRGEGVRVKKAIHGLKAFNDLKAMYNESIDSLEEVRMDRFYKKYIETSAPYKDGSNAVFGEPKITELNKKWKNPLEKKALLNRLYLQSSKEKIGDFFGDLFDFKCDTHRSKRSAEELLFKVTAKHIVTMFRAFDELQSLSVIDKHQIIDGFLQKEILQEQGWSTYSKRETKKEIPMSFDILKDGVSKYLNFEKYRMYSEEEIMHEKTKKSQAIANARQKRNRTTFERS